MEDGWEFGRPQRARERLSAREKRLIRSETPEALDGR